MMLSSAALLNSAARENSIFYPIVTHFEDDYRKKWLQLGLNSAIFRYRGHIIGETLDASFRVWQEKSSVSFQQLTNTWALTPICTAIFCIPKRKAGKSFTAATSLT